MDKTTVCNEAVAAETSGDTRDEVNNKSGMGFEARKCDWGDVRDDALSSDRHRGYTCAGVSECGAYSLVEAARPRPLSDRQIIFEGRASYPCLTYCSH